MRVRIDIHSIYRPTHGLLTVILRCVVIYGIQFIRNIDNYRVDSFVYVTKRHHHKGEECVTMEVIIVIEIVVIYVVLVVVVEVEVVVVVVAVVDVVVTTSKLKGLHNPKGCETPQISDSNLH